MKKKYITETSEDYALLDKHTGELLEYKAVRSVDIETFIMVFFSCIPELVKLRGVPLKVLICCWKLSSFNPVMENTGNIIYTGPAFKEACRREGFSISDANIDNAISTLCKEGFLIRKHRGVYLLNPDYFFKGTLSDRTKVDYQIKVNSKK